MVDGFDEEAAVRQESHVAVRMPGRDRLAAVAVEPDDRVHSDAAESPRDGGLVEIRIAREQAAPGRHRDTLAVCDVGAALVVERHADDGNAEVVGARQTISVPCSARASSSAWSQFSGGGCVQIGSGVPWRPKPCRIRIGPKRMLVRLADQGKSVGRSGRVSSDVELTCTAPPSAFPGWNAVERED